MNKTIVKFGYPDTLIKEYSNWVLLLRKEQVTLGSLVLICKDKATQLSDISKESFEEFPIIIKEIEVHLSKLFSYDKINYLMLMMVDPDVHYHIIPRYSSNKDINGTIFKDYGWPGIPDIRKTNILEKDFFNGLNNHIRTKFNMHLHGQKKFKRVYTTGAYDLFHYGHLNILKTSKEIADYLIVGVSTDELIQKEKNRIPIVPFEKRVEIIKSIKYVDEVVPQTDKNKQRAVDELNINAITVGDDWKGRYPPVTCELVYIPYTKEISSTYLRNKLDEDEKQKHR